MSRSNRRHKTVGDLPVLVLYLQKAACDPYLEESTKVFQGLG